MKAAVSRKARALRSFRIQALAAAAFLIPFAAAAQDAGVEQVVVSSTRVNRSGYDAPTPTTVVGAEDIAKKMPVQTRHNAVLDDFGWIDILVNGLTLWLPNGS